MFLPSAEDSSSSSASWRGGGVRRAAGAAGPWRQGRGHRGPPRGPSHPSSRGGSLSYHIPHHLQRHSSWSIRYAPESQQCWCHNRWNSIIYIIPLQIVIEYPVPCRVFLNAMNDLKILFFFFLIFVCLCSGGAGGHQGVPCVHADQREEDQHPEPAAAEHAGRSAAPLSVVSGKHSSALARWFLVLLVVKLLVGRAQQVAAQS